MYRGAFQPMVIARGLAVEISEHFGEISEHFPRPVGENGECPFFLPLS